MWIIFCYIATQLRGYGGRSLVGLAFMASWEMSGSLMESMLSWKVSGLVLGEEGKRFWYVTPPTLMWVIWKEKQEGF